MANDHDNQRYALPKGGYIPDGLRDEITQRAAELRAAAEAPTSTGSPSDTFDKKSKRPVNGSARTRNLRHSTNPADKEQWRKLVDARRTANPKPPAPPTPSRQPPHTEDPEATRAAEVLKLERAAHKLLTFLTAPLIPTQPENDSEKRAHLEAEARETAEQAEKLAAEKKASRIAQIREEISSINANLLALIAAADTDPTNKKAALQRAYKRRAHIGRKLESLLNPDAERNRQISKLKQLAKDLPGTIATLKEKIAAQETEEARAIQNRQYEPSAHRHEPYLLKTEDALADAKQQLAQIRSKLDKLRNPDLHATKTEQKPDPLEILRQHCAHKREDAIQASAEADTAKAFAETAEGEENIQLSRQNAMQFYEIAAKRHKVADNLEDRLKKAEELQRHQINRQAERDQKTAAETVARQAEISQRLAKEKAQRIERLNNEITKIEGSLPALRAEAAINPLKCNLVQQELVKLADVQQSLERLVNPHAERDQIIRHLEARESGLSSAVVALTQQIVERPKMPEAGGEQVSPHDRHRRPNKSSLLLLKSELADAEWQLRDATNKLAELQQPDAPAPQAKPKIYITPMEGLQKRCEDARKAATQARTAANNAKAAGAKDAEALEQKAIKLAADADKLDSKLKIKTTRQQRQAELGAKRAEQAMEAAKNATNPQDQAQLKYLLSALIVSALEDVVHEQGNLRNPSPAITATNPSPPASWVKHVDASKANAVAHAAVGGTEIGG